MDNKDIEFINVTRDIMQAAFNSQVQRYLANHGAIHHCILFAALVDINLNSLRHMHDLTHGADRSFDETVRRFTNAMHTATPIYRSSDNLGDQQTGDRFDKTRGH